LEGVCSFLSRVAHSDAECREEAHRNLQVRLAENESFVQTDFLHNNVRYDPTRVLFAFEAQLIESFFLPHDKNAKKKDH